MDVSTVISYCTNDYRFIAKCIEEAAKFSSQVIVVVCDHFFDGKPENWALLDLTYEAHPNVQFVEFEYLFDRTYSSSLLCMPKDRDWPLCWHTTTRVVGYYFIRPEIDHVFFLDSDEIADGGEMAVWLEKKSLAPYDGGRFLSYYYALTPDMRATQLQELPLLIKKREFAPAIHANDRYGFFQAMGGSKKKDFRSLEGMPLFHHYSWVRPESECLRKAQMWGHRSDADWAPIISRAFQNKEGISPVGLQLEFESIEAPFFNPLSIDVPQAKGGLRRSRSNVARIGEKDLKKMELLYE